MMSKNTLNCYNHFNQLRISTMQDSREDIGLTFEQLFEMGQQKYNEMDYDQAQYYYAQAYKKKSHDEMIIMCYANILKHNDKPDEAKKILSLSLKNNPNGTYKRYFELAQIQSGQLSIHIFEQGIAAAKKCLTNPFMTTAPQPEIKRDIAQAYASIAEVCMTDLCNIPFEQVEAKCAQVLQKGKDIDPECMDVHLQIANCCIEKDQNELAKNSLLLIKQTYISEKQQLEDELITQCAKLFMEVDEFQHSIQILQKLNQSQSNNPQTVYLLAFCAYKMGNYSLCKEYIEQYPNQQMVDEEVDEAMNELKIQLSKKTHQNGEEKTQDNADGDQQWMDVEDDDDQE